MKWRPKNPVPLKGLNEATPFDQGRRLGFNEGASAMLSAVLKWLYEPCDKHEHSAFNGERYVLYHPHRKDCPQCLSELKEANK